MELKKQLVTMSKLKILQINKYYSPIIGGVESHVKDIVDNLCDQVDFTVLVCNNKFKTHIVTSDQSQATSQDSKTSIYKIASIGKFFSMPVSLIYPFWFWKLTKNVDIIHFHHPFPLGEISYLLSRLISKSCLRVFEPNTHLRGVGRYKMPRIVVTWHSDIEKQKFILFFYRPFLKMFLKSVDKIIVTSPNMAKNSPFLQDFQNKIEVVPLGINIEKYIHPNCHREVIRGDLNQLENRLLRRPKGAPRNDENNKAFIKKIDEIRKKYASDGKLLLLSVGRLVYYKGFGYLIEAMREVDANLLIIGSGFLKKELMLHVTCYMLHEKVHIIDPVSNEELINYYHACDIFILPSVAKSEAFAIVQLEAMICGKPVINTNLPTGVPWVSLNDVTGITIEPKNALQLSKAINRLIKNNDLRIKYGNNARKRVLENFTQGKMIERIYNIYTQ
ncbi:MAG: hypothetical protein ACD_26C00167G0001 [uncultured bacterium]|nr:MAG: hypothetical protein ACD_26C00167G0001 [uncultured bacterium]